MLSHMFILFVFHCFLLILALNTLWNGYEPYGDIKISQKIKYSTGNTECIKCFTNDQQLHSKPQRSPILQGLCGLGALEILFVCITLEFSVTFQKKHPFFKENFFNIVFKKNSQLFIASFLEYRCYVYELMVTWWYFLSPFFEEVSLAEEHVNTQRN